MSFLDKIVESLILTGIISSLVTKNYSLATIGGEENKVTKTSAIIDFIMKLSYAKQIIFDELTFPINRKAANEKSENLIKLRSNQESLQLLVQKN